ncbi:MAG: hypothetical protein GY702_10365 [Desulfobulbaceae bacterium]|nr:hypothetical protein [Desulfobulbaceae bacterium]
MFFGPKDSPQCSLSLKKFFTLADSLGLPIKKEKTIFPSTSVELHGLLVDTHTMTLSVPPDKVKKALDLIAEIMPCKRVTLRRLQSLAGLLSFFTRALPSARCFIRRIFDLFKGVSIPSHHIRLNSGAKADLKAWQTFLTQFNGTNIITHLHWSDDPDCTVVTDASGSNFAGVFGRSWFWGRFPNHWMDKSIAVKEMVPIYIAFRLWGQNFVNKRIVFYTDNESVSFCLQHHTSHDSTIMSMLRKMVVQAMQHNIVFTACHIPGASNTLADALSRLQLHKARQVAPWLHSSPDQVPSHYFPWRTKLQL